MDVSNKSRDDLELYEKYSAPVDRMSMSGNAIISLSDDHVNLGPIGENAVGEEVEFTYLGGYWGICKTKEFEPDGYISDMQLRQVRRHKNTQIEEFKGDCDSENVTPTETAKAASASNKSFMQVLKENLDLQDKDYDNLQELAADLPDPQSKEEQNEREELENNQELRENMNQLLQGKL